MIGNSRGDITLWAVLLMFWIFAGIYSFQKAYLEGDGSYWGGVGGAAFWIGICWYRIWEYYDEAKNGDNY